METEGPWRRLQSRRLVHRKMQSWLPVGPEGGGQAGNRRRRDRLGRQLYCRKSAAPDEAYGKVSYVNSGTLALHLRCCVDNIRLRWMKQR